MPRSSASPWARDSRSSKTSYFLEIVEDAGIGTWIVRGFGTAIMHGGATAIFAVMGVAMLEAAPSAQLRMRALVPGLGVAIVLHSAYNHLLTSPRAPR